LFGALAEMERDVIRQRTNAGLEAARARGRKGDRPKATEAMNPRTLTRAKDLYAAKQNTIAEIMQMTGIKSRSTRSINMWWGPQQKGKNSGSQTREGRVRVSL